MDVGSARARCQHAPGRPRAGRVYHRTTDLQGWRHLVRECHPREIIDIDLKVTRRELHRVTS
eukprot:6191625-Pleurochrysis_carterae.AAC.1